MKITKLKELVDKDKIIELQDNKNIADSYWITLQTISGAVEGKIHIPYNQKNKLIIFEPGFPGGGSGYFEELFLKVVLQNGYSAFIIRHVGTIVNGKHSSGYIVCKEKQDKAKEKNQKVLGTKKNNTITDWLNEPKVALESLAPHFKTIILIGHSFGPLACFSSFIDYVKENPVLANRVKRFVSMAGTLGIVRDPKGQVLSQWAKYLNKDWSKERVLIGDTKENIKSLHKAYKKIHEQAVFFPKEVDFIAIHPWGDKINTTDELVHIVESLDMITTLNRGYLIVDKTEYGDQKVGRIAHDMNNLKPKFFKQLIDFNWLPKSQISVLK